MPNRLEEIQSYFAAKADAYDAVDQQLYWRLSDALLWRLITSHPSQVTGGLLLDAGGGTARWSVRLAQHIPLGGVVVIDATRKMLLEAQRKVAGCPVPLRLAQADLDMELPFARNGPLKFSCALCLNNVIGFVADPLTTLERIAACLHPHGRLWLMAPSLWHMAYFYNTTGRSGQLADLFLRRRGRFTNEMPDVAVFTPSDIRILCERAGFTVERIYGFPAFIYPGVGDTGISGDDPESTRQLSDDASFRRILDAELQAQVAWGEQVAARGSNILVVASRRSL